MPLPLTVSGFSKIQIGFTFLVPAELGSPGKGPLNGCVCACFVTYTVKLHSMTKGTSPITIQTKSQNNSRLQRQEINTICKSVLSDQLQTDEISTPFQKLPAPVVVALLLTFF